jgi:hypothetical protein
MTSMFDLRGKSALILATLLLGCSSGDDSLASCKKDGGCSKVVDVLKVAGSIPASPDDPFWSSANGPKKVSVELGPQLITNPQWPNPSIKGVSIRSAMNDSHMALWVEWQDDTVNADSTYGGQYTDQMAVMFPMNHQKELPPITMGAENGVVNIWQWKAVWEQDANSSSNPATNGNPIAGKRSSSVEDLNAEGFSTLTRQEHQDVDGKGMWSNKTWRVVFRRALTNSDANDIQFKHSLPLAIAVWDGGNRETNGQKGISDWVYLHLL